MLSESVRCWVLGLLLLALTGCARDVDVIWDIDEDGSQDRDDCKPSDPAIHPGADDPYGDGIDQNCDGVDGNAVDQDRDGYSSAVDCDDLNDSIHPDASDELGDGVDQNCDGVDGIAVDVDGDGYSTAVDCDDSSPGIYPGAPEDCGNGIDDNCDGNVDIDDIDCGGGGDDDDSPVEPPLDEDGDGYSVAEDCNDSDPAVNPGATEVCDNVDNDCDNEVDEADAQGAPTWYEDSDGDGYGLETEARVACNQPHGYADYSGDCDDSDSSWHPGAQEPDCTDPNDYNCDGSVGYLDLDNDGFAACADCNDSNASINSSSGEVCNSVDDNCDGQIDEAGAVGESTWYLDADGDTWGRANWSSTSCVAPAGFVTNQQDCDDLDPATNPGAAEVCDDGIDNDCQNGDELGDNDGDGSLSPSCGGDDCNDFNATMHPEAEAELCDGFDNDCDGALPADESDVDADGYIPCAPLSVPYAATVVGDDDCDDADSAINPGATEVCNNGIDDDCNDGVDDGCTPALGIDADGDGFCTGSGFCWDTSATPGDCDDDNSYVYPGAPWRCDGQYNDCDVPGMDWSENDDDEDGFIPCTPLLSPYPASVLGGNDCDDGPLSAQPGSTINGEYIYPGAIELCDSTDSDCDGSLVDEFIDTDGEGVPDCIDSCVTGEAGWVSNANTDHDSDGCQDAGEDLDDDNDGVIDSADDCDPESGLVSDLGWLSDPLTTDRDSDGCQDAAEDLDDDNDGVPDTSDNCPFVANGSQADLDGDSSGDACDLDDDNDGLPDIDEDANGNGVVDLNETDPLDSDTDGDGDPDGTDCAPLNSLISQFATEICGDGIDNNCGDGIDEGC